MAEAEVHYQWQRQSERGRVTVAEADVHYQWQRQSERGRVTVKPAGVTASDKSDGVAEWQWQSGSDKSGSEDRVTGQ